MINISNDMYRAMQSNTDFKEYLTITLANGTVLNIPQGDIVVQGNSLTCGSGTNGVPIGMAVARTIRVEIANFDDKYSDYDFYGARIQMQMKYSYPNSSGTTLTSTIPYGYYTVITPETLGTTIVVTAVDDMHKADKAFESNLPFPDVRADTLLNAICSSCGIPIQTTSFTNNSFLIKEKPKDCTFREVIGGIAMLAGGNAFINRDGRLEIKAYNLSMSQDLLANDGLYFKPWLQTIQKNGGSFNPWTSGDGDVLDGGTYTSNRLGCHILYAWTGDPAVDTDDITITGLAIETDRENRVLYGAEGYILSVNNPCVVGKEEDAVALAGPLIVGLTFRAFSGTYIGDPTMEFMDDCVVVDRKGNTYSSFITDVTYNFRGTTEIKNSAEPVIRNNSSYSGSTKTIQRARRMMDEKLSAYDLGIKNLTELMSNSMGFYTTEEVQEDSSKVFYMHDKPTIEESGFVYKRTAQGYAQSTDGGQTWNSGVDYMGNAVMNTIAAKKISADDITSGRLLVGTNENPVFYADITNNRVYIDAKNSQNQSTFFVDSNTGQVDIRANSFTLQGNTIQQIADSSASTAVTNANVPGQISSGIDGALTLTNVFNKLTNNSQDQGIFLQNGKIYINMSYLNTGILTVKDRNNNTTLSVNALTGQVDIKANSFSLSGQTIQQIADTSASNAVSNANISGTAQSAVSNAMTQQNIFNTLTNNGQTQGIYLYNGKIYINMDYMQSGAITIKDQNDHVTFYANSANGYVEIDATRLKISGSTVESIAENKASSVATSAASTAVSNAMTQQNIFNKLTNNGQTQGIFLQNGKLYLNWDYAQGGTLKLGGAQGVYGDLQVLNSNDKAIFTANKDDITFIRYDTSGEVWKTHVYGRGLTAYEGSNICGTIDLIGGGGATGYGRGIWINNNGSGSIRMSSNSFDFETRNATDLMSMESNMISAYVATSGFSDRRAKTNIQPSKVCFRDVISKLKVVEFDWRKRKGHVSAGLVAQDVQEVIPELVNKNHKGDYFISFTGLVPFLIGMCQEQQKTIDEQHKRIEDLEERLARLERMVLNV